MSDKEFLFYGIIVAIIVGILYGIKTSKDGKSHPFL